MTPSRYFARSTRPVLRNTASIRRFSVNVSATNCRIPSVWARSTRRGEEDVTDAAVLPVVADHERRFRPAVTELVEAGDAHDRPAVDRDDRFPVVMIDVSEVMQLGLGEARMRAEEPEVGRVEGEVRVERCEEPGVVRRDRSHRHAVLGTALHHTAEDGIRGRRRR